MWTLGFRHLSGFPATAYRLEEWDTVGIVSARLMAYKNWTLSSGAT
jgi:hypothetical protein